MAAEFDNRLNRETLVVLKNPAYIKRPADQAIDPIGSTPEELGQYIRREVDAGWWWR